MHEEAPSPSSTSVSSQSLISRHLHQVNLQVLSLQNQLAALQASNQAQVAAIAALEARLTWLERLVQAVRRCFAGRP